LNAANTLITAAEGGFHAPSMSEFFPAPFLFEGTPFEMHRGTLIRVIATVAVAGVLAVWAKRMKLVPGRFQSPLELAMQLVTVGSAEDTMGKERAKTFMPLIVAVFFGILFWNVTKLIPFLNMPGTGVIGLPLVITLVVYVTYHWAGIAEKGLGRYLKD